MTKKRWIQVAAIIAAGLAGYVVQRRRAHPAQAAPGEKKKPVKKTHTELSKDAPRQGPKSWGTAEMITNE
jgi:hypothetical protein